MACYAMGGSKETSSKTYDFISSTFSHHTKESLLCSVKMCWLYSMAIGISLFFLQVVVFWMEFE